MGLFSTSDPHDSYTLHITAGPSYDTTTHTTVPVNTSKLLSIRTPLAKTFLTLHINSYRGLPSTSPTTSSYFSHPSHKDDRYSISFSFVPQRAVKAPELLMGFDVPHPVRDRLPPGTKAAVKVVKRVLDPALRIEPYEDQPFVYGPLASSVFALYVGEKDGDVGFEEQVGRISEGQEGGGVVEGAMGSGKRVRTESKMPEEVEARRKFFRDGKNLESWVWEEGRAYHFDFCGPWLDFENLALRVPGVKVGVTGYLGERTHQVRFVVKEVKGGEEEIVFVVAFTLLFGKEGEEMRRKVDGNGESSISEVGSASCQDEGRGGDGDVGVAQTHEKDQEAHQGPHPQIPLTSIPPPPKEIDVSTGEPNTLASTASTLTTSISALFSALGFGPRSDSGSSGQESEPPPPETSHLDAQVDRLSDSTVAEYLQSRYSSLN